jgi:ABC-2 type transport system ATP-binding protein
VVVADAPDVEHERPRYFTVTSAPGELAAGEERWIASENVSDSPAIVVDDLTTRYGELTAVDQLSFTVAPGTVTALLGPNGAGKTTTVETLEGYKRPTEGSVRVLGLDPIKDHPRLVSRIGVMLQEGGVYTGIKPLEVLRLFASYYDDPIRPEELLDRVGLSDRRGVSWRRMSGGEKQRLSLALALVGRPELAFLDEPTAGIDPTGRRVIRDVVRSLRDDGVTVLLTTHDLDEAERLADRVLIIDHGRLLAEGSPHDLRTQGGADELRFAATPGLDTGALGGYLDAAVVETSSGEYVVAAAATPETVAALTAWLAERSISLGDLRAGRQSLEDVFLRLTEREP